MRVDEPHQVVVLDNGQMYRVSGDRAILVNGQPVVLGRLQPGMPATIVSGIPVAYQNGQYVVVQGSPAVVTAPPGSVVAAPVGTVVAGPTSVRMVGRVSDIDRYGNVKVRLTDGNTFEFRPAAGTVWRKGDPVTIDMTVAAPAPSALPR